MDERDLRRIRWAEAEPRPRRMSVAQRVLIAFLASCALAAGCWLVLPRFGVYVPVWVPLAGFGLIAGAAVFAPSEEDEDDDHGPGSGDPDQDERCMEGRAVGCCAGPRPLKMFGK